MSGPGCDTLQRLKRVRTVETKCSKSVTCRDWCHPSHPESSCREPRLLSDPTLDKSCQQNYFKSHIALKKNIFPLSFCKTQTDKEYFWSVNSGNWFTDLSIESECSDGWMNVLFGIINYPSALPCICLSAASSVQSNFGNFV